MATYTIVDKDKVRLGPNEIRGSGEINVNNGDVFIVSSSVADSFKFVTATGNPSNFEVRFATSNTNNFNVEIMDNLDAGIVIASGSDLSDVDIKAEKALSVVMTAGDDVSLGKFEGSSAGTDLVTIGNRFSTEHDIKLNGGDNFLIIGDDATVHKIETGSGAETIIIGDGLVADDIKTGEGDDAIIIGDNAWIDNIDTDKGNDTITIGDNLFADDIKTDEGADNLTVGDGAVIDKIDTGKGDDTVSAGENFTADKLETKDGDDVVIIGAGGDIDDLDGGDGNDALKSKTDFPDATSFETICFARGTRIEGEAGEVPIETVRAGDRIRTLDHGLQCVRWIGSTRVPGRGVHAPVRIAAGALGNKCALWVSQQHRMLLSGWKPELYFGEAEVLVPAKHLIGISGIEIVELPIVEYFHMLFDTHEIVFSEGIESESFHPGAVGMSTLSGAARDELFSLFPSLATEIDSYAQSARLSLKSFEAQILAA